MANYDSLKATVNANIRANNNQEITGPVLNTVLIQMIDSLGAATDRADTIVRMLSEVFSLNSPSPYIEQGLLLRYNGEPAYTTGDYPNYRYTPQYYPVVPGQVIRTTCLCSGSCAGVCFYDQNKALLSVNDGSTDISNEITVPNGAVFVRFCTELYGTYGAQVILEAHLDSDDKVRLLQEIADNKAGTDNVFAAVRMLSEVFSLNSPSPYVEQGLLLRATGEPRLTTGDYPNYRYTPQYYPVVPGQVIHTTCLCGGYDAGVCFYDQNKALLSANDGSTDISNEIIVPNGAVFVRFCTELYGTYGAQVILEAHLDSDDKVRLRQEIADSADNLERRINLHFPVLFDASNLQQGLLNASTGEPGLTTGDYPNYRYCPDYFPVGKGTVIRTNAACAGSFAGICFYDQDKAFVSSVLTTDPEVREYNVPDNDNIAFVRFCTELYHITGGIFALRLFADDPVRQETEDRLTTLEEFADSPATVTQPYFGIDRGAWIADEQTRSFMPRQSRIRQRYTGEVSPERRFIALGFDDFRTTDFSLIIPLLDKYGARAVFNRVHRRTDPVDADKLQVNNVIMGGHELGDHTWLHYKFPFFEPLFNGQDPGAPEGSQVPFPSNSQLRDDAGDGKNAFGKTLTNNVKSDLGYEAPDIDTSWGEMTDAQCQLLRDHYSLMKDTSTNLISILDTLSNTYLGTSGNSRGSWNSTTGKYTGGIFSGCRTSMNHEVWERILLVTNMFFKEKFGLNYDLLTWSMPGSKQSGCYFPYNGHYYYDAAHNKRVGNLARFPSSLYIENDGSPKERSWTDVLREFGYRTTHDTTPASRDYAFAYQFIINGDLSRPDALPQSTNRLLYYPAMENEYTQGVDLQGTKPYEVQMYDGGTDPNKSTFRNEIEQWRHSSANGIIWGAVIDSADTWSERMILEGLLKFGTKMGYEFVTHGEAYDICFKHPVKAGNLIYNPRLRNTAKEFMPAAETVPSNPDGYQGSCRVTVIGDVPVLETSGVTSYRHFGIPYGIITYSAEVKGTGTITIRPIKNDTAMSLIGTDPAITTIAVANGDFSQVSSRFEVKDSGVGAYEDVFGGYGEKIIGLYIEYSAGLLIRNIDLRLG